MNKWKRVLGIGMAAITCVTGCGVKTEITPGATTDMKKNVMQYKELDETAKKQFSQGINDFSFRMLEQLQKGENIFISPYSVSMGFSLLVNGAQGETKEQMEQVLGISDLDTWNRAAGAYMQKKWGKETFVKNANSVWVSDTMNLAENAEKDYFDVVSEFYQAKKHYQDLTTNQTKDEINGWVKEHTGGMIDDLLKENLTADQKLALFNAVYFEGKWMEPFAKEDTWSMLFHGKKETKDVDMMRLYEKEFSYVEKQGLRGVEIPYQDSSIVMDVVMPSDANKDIMEVFGKLSEEEKMEFFRTLSKEAPTEIGTLGIPKFEIEYSAGKDLQEALMAMGMTRAFENADFGKIGENLFVGGVNHIAKVIVEEKGTKAAAVTEIIMMETAAIEEEKKLDFIADRPFLYVIRDTKEDVILFMGLMYEAQ